LTHLTEYARIVQIDERLVVPDWAVIPLHAGTLTELTAAHAENSGERALKPLGRYRFPRSPIHRDVGGSTVPLSTVDNFRSPIAGPVWHHCVWVLVLGRAMLLL
jgi:hypothetical protein